MTVDEFQALFDLKPAGEDRFVGHSPDNGWRRVFGGQVLAQALAAAERTVVGRPPHSLHAYFLLGGDPKEPILFEVERLRDGRSFTTRRVVARQRGEAIFTMVASFHESEPGGLDHALPAPDAPKPETCQELRVAADGLAEPARHRVKTMLATIWPLDHRPTDLRRYIAGQNPPPAQTLWTRIGERLPDDPALHRAAILYMSDFSMLETALAAHGRTIYDPDLQIASLDHAFWFHRPGRADDWLLYVQDSPNASGATGLVRGQIYSQAGVLLASVAQEGLLRIRPDKRQAD
jgi:acyl-CoA thioesterase II